MALKIRLQRKGRRNAPIYWMVVAESTSPRDGRYVDQLGVYNPNPSGQEPEYNLNMSLVDAWIKKGAKPTETVSQLLKKARKNINESGVAVAAIA